MKGIEEYKIQLSVNDKGFWLAEMAVYLPKNAIYTTSCIRHTGEVTDNPGEAVTTLLQKAGVEVNTGAIVIKEE